MATRRPPYEPTCCCYKDSPEIRNDPSLIWSPDDSITAREEQAEIDSDSQRYLFRNAVSC